MATWSLFLVALLAFAAALSGALATGSFLGRLRGLLAFLGLAAVAAWGAESWASGSLGERLAAGLLLGLLALTATRAGLLAIFDFLLGRRLGVAVPRLTRDVVSGVVYLLVVLLALQLATGTDLRAFLAASAVVTLILGLALQETLGTLIAGLTLLGDRRLTTGTWMEMDGLLGQVEELTWRALVLRTRTGQRVLVPNNQVARSSLRVWPLGEPGAVTVHLGTEYGASPAQVKAILQRVAESIPEVLAKPAPQFLLASFGESALSWECRLWTLSPEKQGDLTDAFLTRAWAALRRQGVEIPFPQRVLQWAQPPREKPSSEAVRAAFLACPTFASLPPPLLEALAAHSRLVTFANGELVLKEGEASRALYVVSSGMARVVKAGQEVARLGPGELFGEMAFLTGQPRVASVLALGELRAVEVDEEALRHALRQQPALAEELAQRVADLSSALQRQQELLAVETPQALKSSLLTRLLRFMGAGP